MELGILVNSDQREKEVIGITNAALDAGHSVRIFPMDCGTRLLESPAFIRLSEIEGVSMAYCALSAENWKVNTDGVPKSIKAGDQFNNAMMQNETDKVIVL